MVGRSQFRSRFTFQFYLEVDFFGAASDFQVDHFTNVAADATD
jgi:hypothetical protein